MPSNDQVARSVALEQAYVYDVYEQFLEKPNSKPWPRVQQFIEELEPGSLVCDVGCGSGKYLSLNSSVFNMGGERSRRLGDIARDKDNEVMILDNLALPFRDESLDAVLSIAVVHHFTTTERRIRALRELARVMRIGGRIIISVWAMEQSHRKFESQDVLVPWHRPQHLSTPSLELTSTTNTSEDDFLPPYHAYTQSDSDSNKSERAKLILNKKRSRSRHKGRSIDPGRSSSPSSSSLSSPNETCYSFVRRAIQKLAGARRSVQRPWFLDSWTACTKEPSPSRYDTSKCDCCDCEDVQNLPIELRRIDDEDIVTARRQTFPSSQLISELSANFKSRSLTDMKTVENNNIVRSKSIVPSGSQTLQQEEDSQHDSKEENKSQSKVSLMKPRLVKQKKSICDEDAEEALDKPTDMKNLVRNMPDFKILHYNGHCRGVFKQRSLNEEIMSAERIKEKENVKRNIQKQTSLNEELIFQRHRRLDSLKDSLFSVSTSKRLQLIKTGFTNKFKTSTGIEKVSSSSLKNGFVRIFQNWKSTELVSPTIPENETVTTPTLTSSNNSDDKKDPSITSTGERRHSKEDNSDSSKDSSLQSDTSVDSEDSFASVIFIPKTDPTSPTPLSPGPVSPRLNTSVPNSPRIKQSSCPTSPRIKQMPLTVYPLTKQLSSPKAGFGSSKSDSDSSNGTMTNLISRDQLKADSPTKETKEIAASKKTPLSQKYSVPPIPKFKKTSLNTKTSPEKPPVNDQIQVPSNNRDERLKSIRELLKQKPGFGVRSSRSNYPIVRHSTVTNGNFHSIARPLPKLLSLELFNPETDDKDSDSSAVSSPDSIDSVVENKTRSPTVVTRFPFSPTRTVNKSVIKPKEAKDSIKINTNTNDTVSSMSLIEAAANVANSLDNAVNKVIKSSPRSRRRQMRSGDILSVIQGNFEMRRTVQQIEERSAGKLDPIWAEDCRRHLTDFADKLSEKLLQEIHQYQHISDEKQLLLGFPSNENLHDPYINRLSEELDDLSKLSAEIQKQNEYLAKLTASDSLYSSQCVKCKFGKCSCDDGDTTKQDENVNVPKTNTNNADIIRNSVKNPVVSAKQSKIESVSEDPVKALDKVVDETDGANSKTLTKNYLKKGASIESYESEKESSSNSITSSVTTSVHFELGESGDSSDRGSKETNSSTSRYSDEGSTLSLVSCPDWRTYNKKSNSNSNSDSCDKQFFSSDKIEQVHEKKNISKDQSMSNTSQESLPSDNIGGAITFHRYYHVFKEGELDQLIERHVQNLHIISSYYDHASWCIVAEKVQVWTI